MADDSKSNTLATITAVLALASTILGLINNHRNVKIAEANGAISRQSIVMNDQIKLIESDLKKQQEDRAAATARNELVIKVYDEVEDATRAAPGDAGERQQKAVIALVSALLKHDPKLQSDLLEALAAQSLPSVKPTATRNLYAAQETVTRERQAELNALPVTTAASDTTDGKPAASSAKLGNYDFDIFWCEMPGRQGEQAEQAAKAIGATLTAQGAEGRVRTRILPAVRNADPGYRNNGFVIRYNAPEETAMSQTLAQLAGDAAQTIYGTETRFIPKASNQKTHWYLSAFVCPGAWPQA